MSLIPPNLISKPYKNIAQWQAFTRVPSSFLPRDWRSWVLDRGSLTKRLIRVSQGDFYVDITYQGWKRPAREEALTLGLRLGELALIREVALCCHNEIWVRARSVIPISTLRGEERQLQYLGTKPLGAFLFRSRAMRRQALELASFQGESGEPFFARRSVFVLHNKPLLVSEFFLPEILQNRCGPKALSIQN